MVYSPLNWKKYSLILSLYLLWSLCSGFVESHWGFFSYFLIAVTQIYFLFGAFLQLPLTIWAIKAALTNLLLSSGALKATKCSLSDRKVKMVWNGGHVSANVYMALLSLPLGRQHASPSASSHKVGTFWMEFERYTAGLCSNLWYATSKVTCVCVENQCWKLQQPPSCWCYCTTVNLFFCLK